VDFPPANDHVEERYLVPDWCGHGYEDEEDHGGEAEEQAGESWRGHCEMFLGGDGREEREVVAKVRAAENAGCILWSRDR
jgi:hypothetical protein